LRELLDQRESYAGALHGARTGGVHSGEALKDAGEVLPRDAAAGIRYHEIDACALEDGVEHPGQVGREDPEVGRQITGIGPAGLDARELEERVDELLQPAARLAGGLEQLPVLRLERPDSRTWRIGSNSRVRGVRSSWLMLLKKIVFARSRAETSRARSSASCFIRALPTALSRWAATSL